MMGARDYGRQAEGLIGLRALEPASCRGARAIAIASGKGGVGKTNLAVNLGIALTEQGSRVLLFDGDLGLANADVLLGVRPEATLADVVAGRCRLSEVVVQAPGGMHLAPGGSGLAELMHLDRLGRERLLSELGEIERSYDLVLMDLAAGLGEDVVQLLACAAEVLLVTTPEPTALTDAYALVKVAHRGARDSRFSVVVNQARGEQDGRDAARRLQQVARAFLNIPISLGGVIPFCDEVPAAVRAQVPVLLAYPRGRFAQGVRKVAEEMAGQPRSKDVGGGVAGVLQAWFRRLVSPSAC